MASAWIPSGRNERGRWIKAALRFFCPLSWILDRDLGSQHCKSWVTHMKLSSESISYWWQRRWKKSTVTDISSKRSLSSGIPPPLRQGLSLDWRPSSGFFSHFLWLLSLGIASLICYASGCDLEWQITKGWGTATVRVGDGQMGDWYVYTVWSISLQSRRVLIICI